MTARCTHDRGSATVLVLVAAAVTLACAVALAAGGAVLLAGARARTAADLAALAAADALGSGRPPCPAATAVAGSNGALLLACDTDAYGAVVVLVEARPPAPMAAWTVRARARAEPGGVARGPPGYDASVPEEAPVNCPSCSSEVATDRRFCPSCGTPLPVSVPAAAHTGATPERARTAGILLPDGVDSAPGQVTGARPDAQPDRQPAAHPDSRPDSRAEPYPAEPARPTRAEATGTTRVLAVDPPPAATPGDHGRPAAGLGERLAPAGDAVRRRARVLADRYRAAPADVRLALVGAVVTVAGFLLLPYAAHLGTAAAVGGRLWWRPLAAVAATVLLAAAGTGASAAPRAAFDRLLAAVVVATAGATEAGLVGLVSGDADRARAGYYVMLAGLVVVLVASVRAARRRCAG